jgi:hypothetical protein
VTRVIDLLQRFADSGQKVGNRLFLPPQSTRRLIAAATEAQIAITRLYVASVGELVSPGTVLDAPRPGGAAPWEEVVFRANGEVLRMLDAHAGRGDLVFAADLIERAPYYAGRTQLPLSARHDDELVWELRSLGASLGAAAAAGAPTPFDPKLAALRDELARRQREKDRGA